jgi:hypothetical protein
VRHARDTLPAWYERRWYGMTGETKLFPNGDARFGSPLRDDLCFVLLEKDLGVVEEGIPVLEKETDLSAFQD